MMKHKFKVIENYWGDIFIISYGIRRDEYGSFATLELAQKKCDELNGVNDETKTEKA